MPWQQGHFEQNAAGINELLPCLSMITLSLASLARAGNVQHPFLANGGDT
jgi:hypothetical protein